ncbi:MAG: NAD-dependent epimerase/dehydratase family protein [Candidatus Eisenbacteria bacterium]|uniref:NAD-dependent epimerase/dehydratase family protein n=1 Tax=Eiseniibacteriota bacterium TaxID=2212470 RepID=A0A948RRI9_UNCEI|nr:NAD-dependent epimerase/dehydratase family protein [Candidatus Eisenbacteria bacterium]MBU1949268.1 NAD-dependent epimerase/dehydratase family protein [Candidatus Eisenbacteria bacterium]MBU2689688.1 NAD-dependent epimerase/dehydratase family protein [Candidatus Eisenbacteria bacterium]
MKILVSGGAGFIGSHLTDALVNQGHRVIVVDNLSSGRLANLKSARATGRAQFIRGNVKNRTLLRGLLPGVDLVFHLAAAVGVRNIIDRPLESLMNNLQGAASILEACHQSGGIKVVLFSSSEVYGKGLSAKLKESDDCILGPTSVMRWSYAASKVVDEFMALSYGKELGLPVVAVRCFNTCGPRQLGHFGMVLPRLILQALKGETMTVYGDGLQSRCFSFVGDVVRGVLMLAENPAAEGDVFNIGSDQETTVLDLAERIKTLTGSSSRVRLVPYADVYGRDFEDIRRRVPSLDKITHLTGYRPLADLDTLLLLTIRDIAKAKQLPLPESVTRSALPSVLSYCGPDAPLRVPC